MSLLGDVGGWLLSVLYSYRVPAAIATLAIVVIVAIVARRGRWLARARRHPRVLAMVGIPTGIIGLAVAWYLLSPLLIRTTLNEPPVAAPSASLAATPPAVASPTSHPASPGVASTQAPGSSVASPSASSGAPSPTPWTAGPARTGTFQGTDEFHFGRGTASLTETAPGEWTLRLADFSVRNGPDLYVYLSPDPTGYGPGAVELEQLRATDGSFNVSVPTGADVASQRSVLIWCKQFSHLFAYATLQP